MKTVQCMKINVQGAAYVCTFTPGRKNHNAYQLYKTWWEPGQYGMHQHRQRIAEYANFESVMYHLLEMRIPEFKLDYFPG